MTDTTALNAETTILLATFMWRRRLNSVALANAIHRRPGKVADRTSTQVKIQMINRCRVKMSQKGLYRLKDSPQKKGGGKREKKKERTFVSSVSCLANLYERRPPRIRIPTSSDGESTQLYDTYSHIIIFKVHISRCLIYLGPVLRLSLYKFIVLGSLGQETVQFDPKS